MSQDSQKPKHLKGSVSSAPSQIWILVALALAGFFISIYQTIHFYDLRSGEAGFQAICDIGPLDCTSVMSSEYAELAFGIPLSSFAAGWFLAILLILLFFGAWASDERSRATGFSAVKYMTFFSLSVSVVYLGIMFGVLKSPCLFCLIIDGINLVSLFLVLSLKSEGAEPLRIHSESWKKILGTVGASLVFALVISKRLDSTAQISDARVKQIVSGILVDSSVDVPFSENNPIIGATDAPITIVKFSDFECPACKRGALSIHPILKKFDGKVRYVFKNFPLDSSCNREVQRGVHRNACKAALVAACAQQQGKFAPVYESFFDNQTQITAGKMMELAAETGLDSKALESCVEAKSGEDVILKDIEDGINLGVRSTPTFFFNGKKVEGSLPPAVWEALIQAELEQ